MEHTAQHPIGVVVKRTGLKPDLIRAWERRYGAVRPRRSATRRRLYTDADIERLLLLRNVVDGGRSIGQVAGLDNDELAELIAGDAAATARLQATNGSAGSGEPASAAVVPTSDDRAASLLEEALESVRRLDARALEAVFERGAVALSRIHLLQQVLVPLMHRIGDLWREGELRPIHEHLASSVARSFLGGLAMARGATDGTARLLVATPPRQHHELGALLVTACAAEEGWNVTYLGADLPIEELVAAVRQTGARAVALSLTYPPDDPGLAEELHELGRSIPDGTHLLVGGRTAADYAHTLSEIGARRIDDLGALRRELARLRASGAPS